MYNSFEESEVPSRADLEDEGEMDPRHVEDIVLRRADKYKVPIKIPDVGILGEDGPEEHFDRIASSSSACSNIFHAILQRYHISQDYVRFCLQSLGTCGRRL